MIKDGIIQIKYPTGEMNLVIDRFFPATQEERSWCSSSCETTRRQKIRWRFTDIYLIGYVSLKA